MPTGYTYAVQQGKTTSLRDFAFDCARGMGALVMMRDEPSSAPIPERFEPSTSFHDERLATARAELDRLPGLTDAECETEAAAEYGAALARWQKRRADAAEGVARYDAMIAKVEAWEGAPEGLKEFMLQQLRESRQFDGPSDYDAKPVAQTGMEWRRAALEKAAKDVGYHETERAKEINRTEERNRWLAQLRASLPGDDR